ncbi:MAG: D-alanyl-D-alanine carboxypeptidase/D-alanyl-D-alanine-endopeptidase [Bacteroidales bacterium]|nr:D-alanyl-D-alanine carboxypeptidase/D-alanyl-D-alanine-endopeptidase [Bacteroidales bacterium]
MTIKKILPILASTLLCLASQAQNTANLNKLIEEMRSDASLKHASLSISVYNITTDALAYESESQRSLIPASINKIYTTAAGFDQLGSSFRFKTSLDYSGEIDAKGVLHGNIYITGGGDPLLGSYRYKQTQPDSLFANWMLAMTKLGIKGVDGRICYDAGIFDNQLLNNTWQWGDIGNYYACGVSGLNFHENMYFAYFNAGKKVGYPATIDKVSPKNINILNQNAVTTGPENSGDQVTIYGDPNNPMRHYHGTVPLGKSDFPVRGALPKPAETCAELFSTYLRTHGISVSNSATMATNKPAELKSILAYYSNTYYVIAQYTNQTSNNMYAECIFKYLGYQNYGLGTFDNGVKSIQKFFDSRSLKPEGIRVVDGSGLSRANRTTTDFMCQTLTRIYHSGFYRDFVTSLSRVGESGTARNMLPGLDKNIEVSIKSGTMSGIKSYAGYITNADNQTLCFCIICNGYDCSESAIKAKMEKVIREIATMNDR